MAKYTDNSNSGAEVEVDPAQADWLKSQGYISESGEKVGEDEQHRGEYVTAPPADADPTLAENAEPPAAIEPHVANEADEEEPEPEKPTKKAAAKKASASSSEKKSPASG